VAHARTCVLRVVVTCTGMLCSTYLSFEHNDNVMRVWDDAHTMPRLLALFVWNIHMRVQHAMFA
jgi:hypothetical protein